jgi:hypothetical protein
VYLVSHPRQCTQYQEAVTQVTASLQEQQSLAVAASLLFQVSD